MLQRVLKKLGYQKPAPRETEFYIQKQRECFQRLGLDFDAGRARLDELRSNYPFLESSSQHAELFSAMSIVKKFDRILEIGTHDGKNAFLFSKLFPSSEITTIDLPNDHPIFQSTYKRGRSESRLRFIEDRDRLISDAKQVTFRQMDSVELSLDRENTYDLIWVDGAHDNPVVTIDITNAIRMLRPSGIVACDDIWMTPPNTRNIYVSIDATETINQFRDSGLVSYELVYKRLTNVANKDPKRRQKFIAVLSTKDPSATDTNPRVWN